jgi:hypothetical protein
MDRQEIPVSAVEISVARRCRARHTDTVNKHSYFAYRPLRERQVAAHSLSGGTMALQPCHHGSVRTTTGMRAMTQQPAGAAGGEGSRVQEMLREIHAFGRFYPKDLAVTYCFFIQYQAMQ